MPTISLDVPALLIIALAFGAYLIPLLLFALISAAIRFAAGSSRKRADLSGSPSPRSVPAHARRRHFAPAAGH
jgi:hypothetical protein